MTDARYIPLDVGSWILDLESRTQDHGPRILNPGSRILKAGSPIRGPGSKVMAGYFRLVGQTLWISEVPAEYM